ncbi:MAG: hypothetical protein JST12_01725 [Armatimonadetes bacterium]|nr:hypothetical protein [Armatimonadota bacterium]
MTTLLLGFALGQTVLKDVHIAAMPLDKALDQLGQIYRSPMDVSVALKDKVILVDADQVSEQEVRDQIAKTINGYWEKKENTWHLTKSEKEFKQDDARVIKIRRRFLQKTLEMRESSLAENEKYSPQLATQTFHQLVNEEKNRDPNGMGPPGPTPASYKLPHQRLFSQVLKLFGVDRIAAIPNGHRVVYALHPNKMQQPMDLDLTDLLDAYHKEELVWMDAVKPIAQNPASDGKPVRQYVETGADDYSSELQKSFGVLPDNLANILFTVYCSEDGSYQMRLIGIPATKDVPPYQIGGTSFEGAFAGMSQEDFQLKPVEGFKLSPDADDFRRFFESRIAGTSNADMKKLAAKFADPMAKDPLAYGFTETMVFDSRRTHHNVVACVSDSSLNIFEPFFGQVIFEAPNSDLVKDMADFDGKWVRIPYFPGQDENIPRRQLKNLIARVRQKKTVDLFDRAEIAASRRRTNSVSYIERLLDSFGSSVTDSGGDDDTLKIIGLLTSTEQAAAFRPAGIAYSQLNERLRAHLFECCFDNQTCRLQSDDRSANQLYEATQIAPNGIPADAVFKVVPETHVEVKAADEKNAYGLMTDPKGWGSTKYQLEHPEDFLGTNFTLDKKHPLYKVDVSTYNIQLNLSPTVKWSSTLRNVVRTDSSTFTMDTFPDDLKADFDAGYKLAAEQAKVRRERRQKSGGGG